MRAILTGVLLAASLWIAIGGVLPTPTPTAADPQQPRPAEEITWRRTDEGWIPADEWLAPQPDTTTHPTPKLHPFTALPLIITISLLALILERPREG